jgi:hypothetical protein
MHHTPDFPILPPAKAKAAALALFDAAMIDPAADWRGVAFALHSVIARPKPVKARDDDGADGFEPWAEYETNRAAMKKARSGRVVVTFSDGWSRSVNIAAPAGKPWRIAAAARFAVTCWRIATMRRLTGSDAALYHVRPCGMETALDSLIACPEITAIVSDDGQDTTAGALTWSPETANRETADYRAGKVAADAPDFADAIQRERMLMICASIPVEYAMRRRVRAIAERIGAALFPDDPVSWSLPWGVKTTFQTIIELDPASYPADAETAEREARWALERAARDAERERVAALPVVDLATWTVGGRCMSETHPDHVIVMAKRRTTGVYAEGLPVLPKTDRSTLAVTFEVALRQFAPWPGNYRIVAPPATMKRFRAALAAQEAAAAEERAHYDARCAFRGEAADILEANGIVDLDAPGITNSERSDMIADALAAWPPVAEPEAPPLALPAPSPVLLLTGPKPKPRYVFRDGAWAMKEAA